MGKPTPNNTPKFWRWLSFAQALIAVFGSLFFSYVLGYSACILCLYQRAISIYLLVIISAGILKPKPKQFFFTAPFALLGAILAGYQHLLQKGVFIEPQGVCSATSISCAETYGFDGVITIPLLALVAFTIILITQYLDYKLSNKR